MPTTIDIESQRMLLGTTPVRKIYQGQNLIGMRIAELFANGEQGVWYDPSDFSTMFQDSGGTTPVTAVEQPVGLMLDKSGRGNHASQATATSRPVLSARVNLLTNTVFSGAVAGTPGVAPTGWSFNSTGGTIVSANDGIIVFSATNARQIMGVNVTLPANVTQTWSVRIEANPDNLPFYQLFFAVDATAAVAQYRANGISVGMISYVPAAGDTLSITLINGATQIRPTFRIGVGTSSAVTGTAAFSRPDLRVANTGAGLPAYQRVNTATDYDTVGFPHYLKCDGVDDGMVTNSIDFTSTNTMTLVAGLRKLTDAPALPVELSSDYNSIPGSMYLSSGADPSNGYKALSRGSLGANYGQSSGWLGSAPDTSVLAASHNIPGDNTTLRRNGVAQTPGTSDKGSGNFGNYPLYLFRRGGTTLPFNGQFYGLVIVGKLLSDSQLTSTEKYINTKTRAY